MRIEMIDSRMGRDGGEGRIWGIVEGALSARRG